MTTHSNLLPPLSDEELSRLRADIEANGIVDPVEVCDHCGGILDGWHRTSIANDLGIVAPTCRVSGVSTPAEHLAYALRRNTSRSQRDPKVVAGMRKAAFFDLRAEGRPQHECVGLLGVVQQTLSRWENQKLIGDTTGREVAVSERVAAAKRMAAAGATSPQIARAIGILRMTEFRKRHGIDVPADALANHNRIDLVRVIDEMVNNIEAHAEGLHMIDGHIGSLDADKRREWVSSLRPALAALNRFTKELAP